MVFKIAVCAGHGGFKSLNPKVYSTAGKRTPDGEPEWNFNNKNVIAFINEMKKYDNVEILRLDDPTGKTDVPLKTRTDKANAWGANIYISFHHNANTGVWGTWTGVETYIYPKSSTGRKLAEHCHSAIVSAYGLRDRGIKEKDLHIVRETKCPAILIEGGFMDSTIDIKKLRDNSVLANAGIGVAKGVAKYANRKLKVVVTPSTNLYRVRKTWADATSQIGAFADLQNAIDLAKTKSGYNVYDSNGKQVYPEVKPAPTPALTQVYRVRKTWADAGSQIGAFSDLENAKQLADSRAKEGYKVFDEKGSAIYTPKVVVEEPTPAPTPIDPCKGHHDIMGKSVVNAEKMVAFVKSKNPNALNIQNIANAFISIGDKYGVRGDIALCQSIIETGWFKFDGGTAVTPDQHNYCGLGVTSKGMKGHAFDNVEDGVTAQIQHLFAYATKLPIPNGEFIIDPRFKYVTRGIAPHWEDLSNRWAMNANYGVHILAIYEQLNNFNYVPKEEKIEEPKPILPQPIVEPIVEEIVETPEQEDRKQEKEEVVTETSIDKWISIVDYFFKKLAEFFGKK